MKPVQLCLGNISRELTINDIKKTGLKWYVHVSFDYNIININYISDIHKYLMEITY